MGNLSTLSPITQQAACLAYHRPISPTKKQFKVAPIMLKHITYDVTGTHRKSHPPLHQIASDQSFKKKCNRNSLFVPLCHLPFLKVPSCPFFCNWEVPYDLSPDKRSKAKCCFLGFTFQTVFLGFTSHFLEILKRGLRKAGSYVTKLPLSAAVLLPSLVSFFKAFSPISSCYVSSISTCKLRQLQLSPVLWFPQDAVQLAGRKSKQKEDTCCTL